MSSRFPGSVLLLQDAIGVSDYTVRSYDNVLSGVGLMPHVTQHTVIEQGASPCYLAHVQAYFQGVVPPANVTCPPQYLPFLGDVSEE